MLKKHFLYLTLFLVFCNVSGQNERFDGKVLDSIQRLIKLSENESLNLDSRFFYAENAKNLSKKKNINSALIDCNHVLSNLYWEKKLFIEYRDINKRNLLLSKRIKDSLSIAKSNLNLGEFYRKRTHLGDSAYIYYHNAEKIYRSLNSTYGRAYALYGIGVIQNDEKLYTESELTLINSLSLLNTLKEETNKVNKLRSFIYNCLGINYNEIGEYEKSINFYKKSLYLKKRLKGNYKANIEHSLNNLSFVYKNSGKFDLAISILNELLNEDKLVNERPGFYAQVLDNYAHTLYVSKKGELFPDLYLRALKIADSVGATYESIIIHRHLAEYYNDHNIKDSAKYHGYKAKSISEKYYKDDLLKSLLILSRVENDSIAVKHYAAYIKLNDSIQKSERSVRNKFTRIQFETDTYIDESKRLATQNILIVVIGLILILLFALLFIIKGQQTKNRVLRYKSEQQKANEEIYTLMLKQRTKIEEGRMRERHRIAEELHDGILSKLCGSRLGLEYLSMNDQVDKEKYKYYMNEVRTIEEEIRNISHDLKNSELISEKDFISILEDYMINQSDIHEFMFNINSEEAINWDTIDDQVKVNLYRIIQEAIQNIVKHAKATHIGISCSLKSDQLKLRIKDNGIGFNTKQHQDGIGLRNIKSRAKKLKGTFKIDSNGTGSKLQIAIPIKMSSNDK